MRNTFLFFFLLLAFASRAQAPTAAFTAAQAAGCAPVVISFQDQSTGNPTAWQWSFGNGSTSTQQNPSTTYFTPGTYTVTLTATNGSGSNTLTRTGYITVYGRPAVSFAAADSAGCAPFSTSFTDQSSAAPGTVNTAWQWDFGNGVSSSAQNPSATYTTPGSYTVSLKVTSDKGCFASAAKAGYINITGGLSLAFTTSGPTRCRAPFPVSFTNTSTGPGNLSYFWSFGDGGTSTAQNPSHTYAASGNYTVTLAVTSSSGCTDTLRKISFVNIQTINTAFTAPDSVCIRTPAAFANTSSPAPQSSLWDFGDGTTSTMLNPQKAFAVPGTYTVRLQNTYAYCTDSASRQIKVLPRPVAAFSAPVTMQCKPPLTVNFSNQSSGAVSWQWNFGDGATSTQQSPSHTYTGYGSFDVTLIVTNASGCTDTLVQRGFVRIQKPVITFPGLPQTGCIPYTTTLAANVNTLDNVTNYAWDLGDGTTSMVANPTHTYPVQGSYKVKLTVTTSTGCTESDSMVNAITVGRVPTVDFTAVPNPVCAFGQVQFTAVFSEGDAFLWNFGDGNTSTAQNPLHQYTDTGSYNVSLRVTNSGCAVTTTKTSFIRSKPPIAGFRYQNDCTNRRGFQFTDTSKGATSWLWDFGDGTTSTLQNPYHVFPAYNTYNVTLTVMNDTCSNSKSISLKLFDENPSFTADKREACKTATVNFTSQVANPANIVSYSWDFGNGTTASTPNGQSVYTSSGDYRVTLITLDALGCRDTVDRPGYIRINGPTAQYTATNNQGCRGLTAQFTSTSLNDGNSTIVQYQWLFGDGGTSSQQNPSHTYNTTGNYDVKLIVTDSKGCKDSITTVGLVSATAPVASFTTPDTLKCLGSTVDFANTSTAQNFTSLWSFGDGNTSIQTWPSHVYADTGTYTVKLKITDQYGCADSVTKANHVTIRKTVAAFSVSDSLGGCTPYEVRYTNNSQFFESSLWQLGNGASTVTNPTQVYNTAGTYYIKLTVTGRGGCIDTAVRTIQIFDASATTFSYTPLTGCKPLAFTGTVNSPANLDFIWDFGDGTTVTTTAATTPYTYNSFGNYLPKVLLSDSGNCLIPLIGPDTVRILGVTAKFGWDRRQFCDSGTVNFLDSTTFNDPIASYAWDFGDGGTSAAASPSHTYLSPGLYPVRLVLQTQAGCTDTFAVDPLVKVVASPDIDFFGDSVICANDAVRYTGLFNVPDTSAVRWSWTFPNGNNSAVQNPAPQTYATAGNFTVQAIATNSSGCVDSVTKDLLVNPLPVITIPSPQVTPLGTPIRLPATYVNNIVSYTWTPATGLNCTDCPQPFASPKFNTLYRVTAVDDNGCRASANVQVIVLCQGSLVFVPNTFSPNGDGSNDVFYVRGKGLNRVKSLRIFNRWGETVFEKQNFAANDASAGWNGTYRGKKLAADVFVYQVEVYCDNGEVIQFNGNVNLLQ